MIIKVDPRCSYRYLNYYLYGMKHFLGRDSVKFEMQPFIKLGYNSIFRSFLGEPIVIEDNGNTYNIILDISDVCGVNLERYEWCDLYFKINAGFGDTKKYDKLRVLGPSFGIKEHGILLSLFFCFSNYIKSRKYAYLPFTKYVQMYLYPIIRRERFEKYETSVSYRPNYIFHASTLWYNEFAWTCTNRYRGEFLKACQKAGVEIEGGLFYLGESPNILKEMPDYDRYKEEYKDFIYESRLSMDDYIRKTKESFVVFNTPAVCECHGWKLAEYLCMGKAIISTPLTREMPGEGLVHGKNVHFVHTTEEIYDAVIKIREDAAYRQQLEQGARAYYEKYLAPEVVIQRILNHVRSLKA